MRKTKKMDYGVIFIIVLVFLVIIAMNFRLIYRMTSEQTEEIGEIQIESIKGNLQETLSDAENALMRVAMGVEQLQNSNAEFEELEQYMIEQKAEQLSISNGVNFNVYVAGTGWEIIPDFDKPADYHGTDRLWYQGAAENYGTVYITEPYIDSMTKEMCFSMSTMLSDFQTVVAMDFNFSEVQQFIEEMSGKNNSTAIIVTEDGVIVGYTDMLLVGKKITDKLPEYEKVFKQVISSKKHESFTSKIGGKRKTVFSSQTNSGWYMILSVDNKSLYSESYYQLAINTAVNLLMLLVVIIFYMIGVKNRVKAEEALEAKEVFLSNLSGELTIPLKRILKMSDPIQMENSVDPWEKLASIKESGLKLSEMLDNLFSYSVIISDDKEKKKEKKTGKMDLSRTSLIARNGMIVVLLLAMGISIYSGILFAKNWVEVNMHKEVEKYENQLEQWAAQQKSILSMYTDMIKANPEIMNDYKAAVKWLNDIAQNYPEISVCYMTNPYKEHTVIMNNGWEPDEDWKVEERQWYIDTENSEDGYNISAPYFDEQTGYYCITMSRIVYGNNGEFLGIFGIDFFMDKLINVLGESYTSDGYAFMVDSQGIIVNHPNNDYQMSNVSSVNIEDTKYRGAYQSEKSVVIKDYNKKESVCLSKKNELTGFSVIVVSKWWAVYSNIVRFVILFIVLFAACIAVIIILVNRLLRWQAEVNRQLMRSADEAVSAGKAKSQFLAQMSHEIRTPINAIIGMDEMILRECDDEDVREYAGNIQSAGKTLLTLINGILDFSKIEDGKMEIIPVKYEVLNLVDDLVNMISEKAVKKGLELKTEIDPHLPKSLFGDDVRIRQVITNILTNAVKYTHEGSVTLKMSGEQGGEESYLLNVAVEDTGIGIKEEDREKLFQSFLRLDEEKNRNIEGTGLGISIVQRLLAMMESELQVESVYGKGSTFSFTIRQKIIDQTEIGNYEGHKTAREKENEPKKILKVANANILVVDDNEMNLKVVRGLMKRCGIVPELVTSGRECIEKVKEKNYDMILLDHMMPEMDGVHTLSKMRKENILPDNTVVIVLTANAIVGARESYMKKGFKDYLSKPIDPKVLEDMLAEYLPKNKISYEDTEADHKTSEMGFLDILKMRGINTKQGLKFTTNDVEFYREMLEKFADDKTEKEEKIRSSYDNSDWENYRILVHALKSTSKTIGADTLSNMALMQENAAKQNDVDSIISGFDKLMEEYYQTVYYIEEALQIEDTKKTIDEVAKDTLQAGSYRENVADIEKDEIIQNQNNVSISKNIEKAKAVQNEADQKGFAKAEDKVNVHGEDGGESLTKEQTTDQKKRQEQQITQKFEEITQDVLESTLSQVLEALNNFEAEEALNLLKNIAGFNHNGKRIKEDLKEVYDAIDSFEFEEAAEKIKNYK